MYCTRIDILLSLPKGSFHTYVSSELAALMTHSTLLYDEGDRDFATSLFSKTSPLYPVAATGVLPFIRNPQALSISLETLDLLQ
jgi:hypothetical protein